MRSRTAFLALLPTLLLVGCTSVDIEGEDKDVWFPTIRLSRDLHKLSAPDAPADDNGASGRRALDVTMLLDMELSFSGGDFDQNLGAGEVIVLKTGTVTGPDVLEVENDIYFFHSSLRTGFEIYEALIVEGMFGLGGNYIDTEVDARSGPDRDDTSFTLGPIIGGRATLRPHPLFEIYGQVMFLTGFEDDGIAEFSTIEAGVGLTPIPLVTFQIAWRRWNYESDSLFQDYDIEHSGLMAGAQINF